ncbi:MAG TPA: hypothetical protein VGN35_11675 [Jatrophihabitantaceae bacterium]|nr:hypothetical protein [Jatrophihabitantaceae bacterium]
MATVECDLDEASLAAHFVGREAYRRTRFIVVRNGSATAVVAVEKESDEPLFAAITAVRLLVGPADCVYLTDDEVDTAVPAALARIAVERAPGRRGVVVRGRYSHVSFIIDAAPLRVTVREVAPPGPPKLLDQIRRVLDVAEHLPPIELVPDVVDFAELAASSPSHAYLLPCRGGGVSVEGATTAYLDERPARQDWTLIGCERSQQIHEWFYGERAPQVDICPRTRPGGTGAILTKCCLLETQIENCDGRVTVPWGASFAQISEALTVLVQAWEPTWAPA